jgi:hypothetical protein
MVGASCLEKLLEVIGRLPLLALEGVLGSGNELLIGIIGLLVVVPLITSGSDCNPLGLPLWPPLVAFGAPLHAFADCLAWCPSAAARDHPPIALNENSPTTSSPEVCLVVMSSSSFMVFGLSRPSSCTRVR